MESKVAEKGKEYSKLENQLQNDKENSDIEVICLRNEKEAVNASLYEANANLRELKIKINRIVDDARVEYAPIIQDESDIESIFCTLRGFFREKSVENRKSAKTLEMTVAHLNEEIQNYEKRYFSFLILEFHSSRAN